MALLNLRFTSHSHLPRFHLLRPISEDFCSDIEENYCLMLSIMFRDALIEKQKKKKIPQHFYWM